MEQFNLPKKEEEILKFWQEKKIFEKTLKARSRAKKFVFFEGPPTANGKPGIHHLLPRAFKDLFARYKTMQGFLVERKAGWDTHGLPVELEVEKKLGIKSKPEIEKYGIGPFNKECRKSVWGYKDEWEKFTGRIAYWLDLKNPYVTYENKYIESLWWVVGQIDKKKLFYQDYKIVPYCSRCGTSLSSHEVAQGYKSVKDPSAYVKFNIVKIFGEAPKEKMSFLAWTTTPWTLPANTALAVGPEIEYAQIRILKSQPTEGVDGEVKPEVVIMAKSRIANVITEPFVVEKEFKGRDLVDAEYEPIFVFSGQTCNIDQASGEKTCCFIVVAADFVSTEDGSGIVHIAPAFGDDDMQTAKKNNLSTLITVNEEGKFKPEIKPWAGMFVKDADPLILADLKSRNILYKKEQYEHDYPFCWRCSTPLLYYPKKTWFVKMSGLRDKLIAENKKVNWVPSHLRDGRFGEWLKEVKDWAFSRERYWGTPLPVWICQDCGHKKVISSVEELSQNQVPRNRYFFMRHAEAEHNCKKVVSCWPETKGFKLTQKGKGQIKKSAAKLLKELGDSHKIDIIFSSDLRRTKETTEEMAKALGVKKIIYDTRLREVDFGVYNEKAVKEYHAFYKSEKDKFDHAPLGGESWNDVTKRIFEFLRRVDEKMEYKNILVVSHGDPLWLLEGAVKNLDEARQLKLKYPKVGDWWEVKYVSLPRDEKGNLDLHRPYIDKVELRCEKCSAGKRKTTMKRVSDVVDVWFDSGAMPFAQWHYPFENKSKIDKNVAFPADFICEAIDQTRGWFYTLLAVSTLLGKGVPYKNVVTTGHVLDKAGQKMSKSKGNVVNPWEMMDKYGADIVRWYLYTINSVGESKLFDEKDLQDRLRNFAMTLINTLSFYDLYGRKGGKNIKIKGKSENVLDKWIIAKLNILIEDVVKNLDRYDATTAGRLITDFVDDLSNWYVRRSRDRFRDENSEDYKHAAATLNHVLITMSELIAPFTPFLGEHIYQSLQSKDAKLKDKKTESVHMSKFPKSDKKLIDRQLVEGMDIVRKVATLGLKLRAQNQLKVRQPIAALKFKVKSLKLKIELIDLIKDELNVKSVLIVDEIKEEGGWKIAEDGGLIVAIDTRLNDELRAEGLMRDIVRNIQDMRKDAKLTPNDIVSIDYCGSHDANAIFDKFSSEIKKTVLAKNLINGCSRENETFIIKREFDLDFGNGRKEKVWIGIKMA